MRKGISLVALVITIVVLIILTATVIITISNGGIIKKSEEAVFKQDFTTLKESFQLGSIDNMIDTLGQQKITATEVTQLNNISSISKLNFDKKTINGRNYLELIQIKDNIIYQSSLIANSRDDKWREISKWLKDIGIDKLLIKQTSQETIFEFDIINENEIEITGLKTGYENVTSLIIPDMIDGLFVVSIKNKAFWFYERLINVIISDSVTNIGESAFGGCSELTNVTIGNSVVSIGESAFDGCRKLTGNLIIPKGVISIGASSFINCESLTSVSIPDSVTNIGDSAFGGCSRLASINIPYGVTDIFNTFSDCASLTSIEIPNSVTQIGDGVFSECRELASVTIPDSVTKIGEAAFAGCTSLTSIEIPNSVTKIYYGAFWGCTSLNSITILQKKSESSITDSMLSSAGFTKNQINNITWLAE